MKTYVNTLRTGILTLLGTLLLLLCLAALPAHADDYTYDQLDSDLSIDAATAIPMYVHAYFQDGSTVKADAIEAIKQLRAEAFDEGIVTVAGGGGRMELRSGMTREEYINNVGWNANLERIAIQRAAECGIVWSHTRPNDTSCFTARNGGKGSSAEVLASGAGSITGAIDLWTSEKYDYVNDTGGETGHYTALINPQYNEYGFSCAQIEGRGYYAAGEAGASSSSDGAIGEGGWCYVPVWIGGENLGNVTVSLEAPSVLSPGYSSSAFMYATYSSLRIRFSSYVVASAPIFTSSDSSVLSVTDITLSALQEGTVTVTGAVGGKSASATVTIAYEVPVYRLYNSASGEHLFTLDANEYGVLAAQHGWTQEGVSWYSPGTSDTAVYRLYNPISGEHHYTTDVNEYQTLSTQHGWNAEGICWYSDNAQSAPVYRLYNSAAVFQHHYTTDANEHDTLIREHGWVSEGIGWYATR